jgi:hypothetical protein
MGANRIGGIITFKIDGVQYAAKGNFTYNLGIPKKESVMGSDGFHGYKETPQAAFIEGEITDNVSVDIKKLAEIKDATILLNLANSKSIVLRNAFYAHEGTGNTDEGNFPVRFEGERAEEMK